MDAARDKMGEGVVNPEGVIPLAPSASATAFRVVSHIRWHGGAAEDTRRVRLFVGVLTGGRNADRRAAIRETWGKDRRLHRYLPPPNIPFLKPSISLRSTRRHRYRRLQGYKNACTCCRHLRHALHF